MKTKQDQINEMVLAVPQTIVAYDANPKGQHLYGEQRQQIAEVLYDKCYRKVPVGAVVLTPEERDDEMKATNEILAERDDLIAKVGVLGSENYDLKAEIKQLKTECALLDDELRIARQETINVLNELKTKLFTIFGKTICSDLDTEDITDIIDELLEEQK